MKTWNIVLKEFHPDKIYTESIMGNGMGQVKDVDVELLPIDKYLYALISGSQTDWTVLWLARTINRFVIFSI